MEFHADDVPELQIVKMEKSVLHCEDCEDESFSLMTSKKISEKNRFPKERGVVIASKCFILKTISLEFIIQHCDLLLFNDDPQPSIWMPHGAKTQTLTWIPPKGTNSSNHWRESLCHGHSWSPSGLISLILPLGRKNENINVKVFELIFLPVVLFTVFDRGKFEKHLITRRSCHKISTGSRPERHMSTQFLGWFVDQSVVPEMFCRIPNSRSVFW